MGKKAEGKAAAKKAEKKAETKAAKKAEASALALTDIPPESPPDIDPAKARVLKRKALCISEPAPATARSSGSDEAPAETCSTVDIGWKKKHLQSNLKGQVSNAIAKLAKSATGEISLTAAHKSDLEQKVKFGQDYAEIKDQKKKDDMLDCFRQDRSCKSWATYHNTYEKVETVVQTKMNGYGTR